MNAKNTSIEAVGTSLIEHVRDAAVTRPGIVEEIFPHIVQASKKISARAIAKFLEEKNGVKVSYVTVGRALRNPAKYWDIYYDSYEIPFWNVAETHGKKVLDFISEPEKFQEMLEQVPILNAANREEAVEAHAVYEHSVKVLDEKWFCFDEEILEEARFHLFKRLNQKPAPKDDDDECEPD